MSDEKNEEAGKQDETELSDDQLEKAAGGAVIPVQTPLEGAVIPVTLEEAVIPFTLEEQNKDEIKLANDPVKDAPVDY